MTKIKYTWCNFQRHPACHIPRVTIVLVRYRVHYITLAFLPGRRLTLGIKFFKLLSFAKLKCISLCDLFFCSRKRLCQFTYHLFCNTVVLKRVTASLTRDSMLDIELNFVFLSSTIGNLSSSTKVIMEPRTNVTVLCRPSTLNSYSCQAFY